MLLRPPDGGLGMPLFYSALAGNMLRCGAGSLT
jgi:hypothetical protein